MGWPTGSGLSTPRLVVLDLDPEIARYEADEEVQDLLNASPGPNLGVDFLPGAFGYDGDLAPEDPAGPQVLWLDAFTANVDRSWRNPNLLRWHGELWVIDHGAALYFHHGWGDGVTVGERFAAQPWDVTDHVLATRARPRSDPSTPRPATSSAITCSPSCWPRFPMCGWSLCPAQRRPTSCGRRTSTFLDVRLATRSWLPLERAS